MATSNNSFPSSRVMKRASLLSLKCVPSLRVLLELLILIALFPNIYIVLNNYILKPPAQMERCCGPGCRAELQGAALHYDEDYFTWQTALGLEKARGNDFNAMFDVSPKDVVADLGAGGGHILATLNCRKRVAVELNNHAREQIAEVYPEKKIALYQYVEDVEDESIDIFFSTSVIEHMECPLTELREVYHKVAPRGRVIIGIKNEGVQYLRVYKENDQDNHIYTWNAQLLGNLVVAAGFEVIKITPSIPAIHEKAQTWVQSNLTNPQAFIYHWVHARKKVPKNDEAKV